MTRTTTLSIDKRDRLLDLSFLAGVGLKVLNIIGDFAAGIPLLFVDASAVSDWVKWLTADQIAENPDDPIALWVVSTTDHLTNASLGYAAIYLLIHGIVKVGIIIAMVRGHIKLYPWVIGALSLLVVYQLVEFALNHSLFMLFLSLLDIVIVWLTWREWKHHRVLQDVLMKYAPKMASRWPFPKPQVEGL